VDRGFAAACLNVSCFFDLVFISFGSG
jgi:hypothetical protein